MQEINKIMVALAFSEYSKGIFTYAAKLAICMNSELIVANVINTRDVEAVEKVVSMGYEVDGNHYIREIENERRELLNQHIKETSLPIERIKTVFRVGNPIDELLKLTVEEEVDMIVMGPKGRTDLVHIFIGSVAEKIFRKSPVTVVSYRSDKIAERLKKRILRHK